MSRTINMRMAVAVQSEWSTRFDGLAEVVLAGGGVRDCVGNSLQPQGWSYQVPRDWDVFLLLPGRKAGRADSDLLTQVYELTADLEFSRPSISRYPAILEEYVCPLTGIRTQLIASRCGTAEELLASFDWAVCQFAVKNDGFLLHGQLPVAGSELRLHQTTSPLSNLRRGFRFCDRYHVSIGERDLRSLLSLSSGVFGERKITEGMPK